MANVDYEPIKKAMNKLKTLSADQEARRLAFVREHAIQDEASLMKQAWNRAKAVYWLTC